MTTPVSMQPFQDVTQSLIYFLENQSLARSGASSWSTNTLKGFHTDLKVLIGYPDRLDKVQLPSLALVNNSSSNMEQTLGLEAKMFDMSFSIHGFVGKQQSHGHNMLLRDELCQEVRALLEDIDYVTLYQYPDFGTSEGDIGITNVIASYIPPSGEPMDATRYQFVVDFEVEYVKKL